ncbi:crossover junction endonuclease EME1A-like isoform X6 [Rhododendron vialii]|uniref:crossover junction endonuclease EME1A-like isoform X6 n=1 Tax=Rhododendron vialii TaxID=182163 RepID=UPI00265E0E42|nr:crossover junction endonuclease EME1A-like isoform X6 [Rhododendron vialii]
MSQPITVDILSDDDDDDEPQNDAVPTQRKWQMTVPPNNAVSTSKRPRIEHFSNPAILLIDDDPTPKKAIVPIFTPSPIVAETPMIEFSNRDVAVVKRKSKGLSGAMVPTSTQSIVAETPMLDFSKPDVAFVKRNSKKLSDPKRFPVPISTPSIVAETPMLDFSSPKAGIGKRNSKGLSDPQKFSGICGLVCLESDNESENGSGNENWKQSDTSGSTCDVATDSEMSSSLVGSESSPVTEESLLAHENLTQMSVDSSLQISSEDGSTQANDAPDEEIDRPEPSENILKRKSRSKVNANKENDGDDGNKKRKKTKEGKEQLREREKLRKAAMKVEAARVRLKEENNQLREREKFQKAAMKAEAARLRLKEEKDQLREREKLQKEAMKAEAELKRFRLKEEKNQLKEREKLQKAAMKAEAAELKKLEKEKQKWEKGKFALNSIVANVDAKVVELGSVGGHLLTRFAEKGLTYRITSNPIERSIVWNMAVPDQISKLSSNSDDIPYVLLVVEAEEFCNLVINETLMQHVSCVRSRYPSHTICYVTNRLMAYINKREQEQYKNPDKCSSWRRPPVEEVLAKLTTHSVRVHSRQCIDEAELAEHVVGLTCSLASCRFRKKLTRLSVNANGSLIPKDCIDKDLFKKNLWLKALIAIPKVQPRFALAIRKKYPTMRSLLNVYMDPNKSVHEKEFLLKDLTIEGLLGDDRRLGEVCSKRVYRILTAQSGSSNTDDVEDGADFFSRTSITPS